MTSSEASSSEAENHQKLQFIKRCKLKDSKVVQWIQCRLSIAKELKRRATTNSKRFKGIGCLFFCRALTKCNCTKCITTTSATQSLSLLQDKDNNSATRGTSLLPVCGRKLYNCFVSFFLLSLCFYPLQPSSDYHFRSCS